MEEQSIGTEIKKIDNLIIRKIMSYSKNNSYMLSPSQMMIIRFLYKNSDKVVYQKDLEGTLPFRKSTISGIIQTMMKNNIKEDDLRVFFKVTKQLQNNLKGENAD